MRQHLWNVVVKAWFPPMRLTYSHVYILMRINIIWLVGTLWIISTTKKKNSYNFSWDHSFIFIRIHKIINIKERPLKHVNFDVN